MKIIAIGDPHIKNDNMVEVDLFLDKLEEMVKEEKPDLIVILGDVLDTHERIFTEHLNKAYEFVKRMLAVAEVFILVGNHDYINNGQFQTDKHWMNGMKEWVGVVIVDKTVIIEREGEMLGFVPYVPEGRFMEALSSGLDEEKDLSCLSCIFAHQEFYGCKMGKKPSVKGDRWEEKFPLVISGHIHENHWIGKNIYYPGSSMQHAFGGMNGMDKNIIVVLDVKGGGVKVREVDLGLPKRRTIEIEIDGVEEIITKIKEEKQDGNMDKIRVVLNAGKEEFDVLKKSGKYRELIKLGVKVVSKPGRKNESDSKGVVNEIEPELNESGFHELLKRSVEAENDPDLLSMYYKVILEQEMPTPSLVFLE